MDTIHTYINFNERQLQIEVVFWYNGSKNDMGGGFCIYPLNFTLKKYENLKQRWQDVNIC